MITSLPPPALPGTGRPAAPLVPAAGCDCGRCPFYTGNPSAAEPVCSGCSASCDYCGCARSAQPATAGGPGACSACPIRCGSRTDITAWMADVGGTLQLGGITVPGHLPPGLPAFIPQVASIPAIPRLDAHLR